MKFPETLVPPGSGAGDEAERFEAHGNWRVSVLTEQSRVGSPGPDAQVPVA